VLSGGYRDRVSVALFKKLGWITTRPSVAAMQEISDWLKKLGMSEYARRFAENRIDVSVLRDLTDQDLKDLGVVLGDRRKMLRAIGELGGDNTPVTPQPALVTLRKPEDAAPGSDDHEHDRWQGAAQGGRRPNH